MTQSLIGVDDADGNGPVTLADFEFYSLLERICNAASQVIQ